MIVESTGGITPATLAVVRHLTRRSAGKSATDRTVYGTTRVSTKSFYTHHTQQMSKAAVMYDARAIRHQVTCKKQKALRVAQAGVAGNGSEGSAWTAERAVGDEAVFHSPLCEEHAFCTPEAR